MWLKKMPNKVSLAPPSQERKRGGAMSVLLLQEAQGYAFSPACSFWFSLLPDWANALIFSIEKLGNWVEATLVGGRTLRSRFASETVRQ